MTLVTWHNVSAVSSGLLEPQPLATALSPDAVERRTSRALARIGTPAAAADELRHLLFDGCDRERVHAPWHTLISAPSYRHRDGLGPAERAALAYERLREVNSLLADPQSLARDPRLLASLHEWAAIVDGGGGLCTVASIHYNLFLGSLLDHEDSGRRDLSDFTSMRRTGTFLCTELEHGNDAGALETIAEYDRENDGFILHTPTEGARKFMPNTSPVGGPKSALVAARLVVDGHDEGVFLFLTPLSDEHGTLPGIDVRPLPLRPGAPVDHCLTAFDHVRLGRSALLEAEHGRLDAQGRLSSTLGNRRKRFLHSISRVTAGKLCMSGAAVGASRAALAIAVRYAQHRHVSGPRPGERVPLQAHRSHHSRLLDSLATAYAMTFAHRETVDRWCAHDPAEREDAERQAAVMKGWITWQARAITTECRERCGAQGLFSANGLADFPQYTEGTITAEGDNLVIWVKAAGEILFRSTAEAPGEGDVPVAERTLTDLRFLRELLADAERLWRTRAGAALRRGPAGNPLGRWNTASDAALEMVGAHAAVRAADAFLNAVEHALDPTARGLLERLCRLFLLRQLGEHTGDLLADGRLTAEHVCALPEAIDTVTAELAPHLQSLVDAFDLPAEYFDALPMLNGAPPLTPALA
ncbi:acyl-CoA dehydrogenase [Streptomyces sp. NBC_01089]|uniref:acyl-CoA dehydrogenase family protein n=1 Tax=Streptomyces sp. NBC_01089 TaxID=2903747 RepID=UPI003870E100|nr:acyl-CoA oxidase [Streptomyces sp. NBC_01089]WSU46276.1 acyl-CoA oxidase [Streptomyces sp. NBC_01089]